MFRRDTFGVAQSPKALNGGTMVWSQTSNRWQVDSEIIFPDHFISFRAMIAPLSSSLQTPQNYSLS